MTTLITGTTGLIGARLLPRLVAAGVHCRALVRGGKPVPAGVEIVEGDLFDPPTLRRAVDGAAAVVHLAAVFRTPDTDLIWKSNLEGTQNLIGAVKVAAPRARFILASTSNVYDPHGAHPGREDDAVDPQHPYPASKVAAEKALQASGLNWAVLRFPFVYGDRDGHLEELPRHAVAGHWHPAKRISTIHHRDIAAAIGMALDGEFDERVVNVSAMRRVLFMNLRSWSASDCSPRLHRSRIPGICTWIRRWRGASDSGPKSGRCIRRRRRG